MGLLKGHVQEWLEDVGFELGYDWGNLPSLSEMDDIKRNNVCAECNQFPYSDTDKMCPVCGKEIVSE